MAYKSNAVRPPVMRLTDADARHFLSAGLIRACHTHGPKRVGLASGCDEKTIRRARDEDSTLSLDLALNVLDIDEHVFDELLGAKGFALHKLAGQKSAIDIIPAAGAAIHRIGMARDPSGPGGAAVTDDELIEMEGDVDAMIAAAESLKSRIIAAKMRRVA